MPHRISEKKGADWVDKDRENSMKKEISAEAWRNYQNLIDGERSRLCWEPEKKNQERKENRNPEVGTREKEAASFLPSALASALEFIFI